MNKRFCAFFCAAVSLVAGAAVLLTAPSFAGPGQEQAVKTFRTRDITVYYTAEDENGIKERILYMTRDDGNTWAKAAPESVDWKSDARGGTYIVYHAREDGVYGFWFQFIDNAFEETPAPRPGDKAPLVAVVVTGPEPVPLEKVLEMPEKGSSLESKSRSVRVPWRLKGGRIAVAKRLWVTVDDGASWKETDDVEWLEGAGMTAFIFNAKNDGSYGFSLALTDGTSYQVAPPKAGDRPHVTAHVTTSLPLVSIEEILLEPGRGTEMKSRKNLVRIDYALKAGVTSKNPILWVTGDNGATWKPALDTAWLHAQEKSSVLFMAQTDGVYGLVFELTDGVTYRTPQPKAGDAAHVKVTVATVVPVVNIDDVLLEPAKGSEIRSNKRDVKISYRLKEGYAPVDRRLWLTRDNGATWRRVDAVEWLFDERGRGHALFGVAADGVYGVALEFAHPEQFITAPPKAGDAPRFVVTIDTAPSFLNLADLLESPKGGETVASGSTNVKIPYKMNEGVTVASKTLWVTADNGKSWSAAENVEWSTDAEGKTYARFTVPADGTYGIQFGFTDAAGRTTPMPHGRAPLAGVAVKTPKVHERPVLLKPVGGEQWVGGKVVVLQWMSTNGFMEKSASLSYSIDGGEWVVITRGLENMGFYRWAPPAKETRKLRIRVTMDDLAGNAAASDPSGDITVTVPANPDIAGARSHFQRARLLLAQKKYDEAIMSYEESLACWDQYPDALNDIASVHYRQGDYGKALEYFLRAREVNRGAAAPCANVGFALYKLGLPSESLSELGNAVALDGAAPALSRQIADGLLELAQSFHKAGDKASVSKACALILQIPAARGETRRLAQALTK